MFLFLDCHYRTPQTTRPILLIRLDSPPLSRPEITLHYVMDQAKADPFISRVETSFLTRAEAIFARQARDQAQGAEADLDSQAPSVISSIRIPGLSLFVSFVDSLWSVFTGWVSFGSFGSFSLFGSSDYFSLVSRLRSYTPCYSRLSSVADS